ncbi:DUF3137 domain-containing protein [Kribbella shirazensis]|uniref:DUF3137 domain-containing protein n=1 Tax=Kribbella shirazensis TaxID=1105143 RepID=A0A7X5VIJ2_9ACTN|nr:DUF3137 domain-containing protein [Kribbella shirazensis]NIK61901.1 hypothetical protein [Kribbella shirazensis]
MLAVSVPRWLHAWAGLQVGFAVFIGFAVLFGWLIARVGGPWVDRAQARLAREQAGAERYGWRPGTDADGQLHAAGCRIFAPDGQLRRILVGEYQGRRIRMAEFVHTTRGRYLPTTWVNHLVAIELPVRLPELAIGPASVVGDGAVVEPGTSRVEVESEDFNRRFRVVGADDRYALAMLHPRMMEWLLARPPVNLRVSGNLVVAFAAKPWTVPQALAALPVLSGVVDLIPPFVLADYGRQVR